MSDTAYRHFKGNIYRVKLFALDSNTEEPVVVYESLKDGRLWTRPHAEFFGTVERGGLVHQRFTPVSEQEVVAWRSKLSAPVVEQETRRPQDPVAERP